jgi:hypothetical protein
MPERVRADVSGVEVNAWIAQDEVLGSWTIVVDPAHNNPSSLEVMRDHLTGSEGTSINVRSRVSYDRRRWKLAMLKIGYLVGFALGGYSYVLRSNLQPIRDQIRYPGETVIDLETAIVHLDPGSVGLAMVEVMDRWLLALTEIDGLAITLNNRMAILPISKEPSDFYAALADHAEPLNFDFRAIASWPPFPTYRIDDDVSPTGLDALGET